MPNWKKVIVSGSDANLRNITASGDISASGLLHASLSFDTTPVTDGVVVYDTAGGRFYYTGSYGGGSGGTIVIKEDGVTTVAAATTIDFLNSIVTESPSGEANVAFDLQGVTDSGAVTSNGSLFLHNQNSSYGFSNSQLAKSGFAIDNSKAYTYATPQRTQNDVYLLGMHITANGVGPYPNNFMTMNKDLYYQGPGGPYDGSGGDTNPDTDHPDDLGGTLVSTGTGFQILASSSISSITKDNKARGMYITPSALYMFNTDASASISGTLIPESASAQIRFNTGSNSIQFLAGSTNETLKEVLFISKSGDSPRIGIGTTNPKQAFDIKEILDSDRGSELLIRSSRTTKGADDGDGAGRINFAIDSSSFGDIETSGSAAEIASIVDQIDSSGVKGSLSFRVSSQKTGASTEKLRITPDQIQATGSFVISGSNSFTNIGPATFSGSVDITDSVNITDNLTITGPITSSIISASGDIKALNYVIPDGGSLKTVGGAEYVSLDNDEVYLGFGGLWSLVLNKDNGFIFNETGGAFGGALVRDFRVEGTNDEHLLFITGGDNAIGIGTSTPSEKLTVQGNISASGDITVTNGTFNDITINGTASIAYFETLYETSSIIFSSGSTKFGDTMDDQHDFTGSVDISGSTDIEGNLSVSGGTIDLKNSGAASKILLYCESNNAHAQTIQAAPHSDVASNTLVLPSTGTKFATQDGAETFTNKTLTSPDINTPDIDGGNIDNTVIGNSTANAGTFTSLTATNVTASGNISSSGDVIANNITASNLDISGDVDVDGTLEADAITVGGTALSSVIAGTTVANAVNALNTSNVNIAATTDNASFFVTMVDGATSDQKVESSTKLKFNPSNGNLFVDGFITASGAISASGDITSNTFETISTTLASDSATNVDTFNSSSYNGAIYDYILKDSTVGARAGQFMVAHDNGNITFTDTSTKHLTDSTIPDITADIDGSDVRVRVTNGNGYTFKSFVKKL